MDCKKFQCWAKQWHVWQRVKYEQRSLTMSHACWISLSCQQIPSWDTIRSLLIHQHARLETSRTAVIITHLGIHCPPDSNPPSPYSKNIKFVHILIGLLDIMLGINELLKESGWYVCFKYLKNLLKTELHQIVPIVTSAGLNTLYWC